MKLRRKTNFKITYALMIGSDTVLSEIVDLIRITLSGHLFYLIRVKPLPVNLKR